MKPLCLRLPQRCFCNMTTFGVTRPPPKKLRQQQNKLRQRPRETKRVQTQRVQSLLHSPQRARSCRPALRPARAVAAPLNAPRAVAAPLLAPRAQSPPNSSPRAHSRHTAPSTRARPRLQPHSTRRLKAERPEPTLLAGQTRRLGSFVLPPWPYASFFRPGAGRNRLAHALD